jgi:hypothetical protein
MTKREPVIREPGRDTQTVRIASENGRGAMIPDRDSGVSGHSGRLIRVNDRTDAAVNTGPRNETSSWKDIDMASFPIPAIHNFTCRPTLSAGALAGIAGGAAEVAWIGIYARMSGGEAATVARGVAESVLPPIAAPGLAAALGVAIHMGLAVLLGIAIAGVLRSLWPERSRGSSLEFAAVVAVLAGVWAMNFFVLLPAINPGFATLVPYWTSLLSKVLFGAAAAFVLHFSERPFRAG